MAITSKKYKALLSLAVMLFFCYPAFSQETPFAVYSSTTACDAYIRQVTGVPANAECEKIKWKLSLFQSTGSKKYQLTITYGLQEQGGPGFIGAGKSLQLDGNWNNDKGTTTDPTAMIYRLDRGKDRGPILLVKIDDNMLHFLFSDKKLLIGNAGYGYVLNRVNN